MPGHDQLFKDLLQTFFGDFLRLVVPKVARDVDGDKARFLKAEVFTDLPEGRQQVVDVLAEVPVRQRKTSKKTGPRGKSLRQGLQDALERLILVHVEIEGRFRKAIDERMWRYYRQITLRHGKPLLPIVIFRTGGKAGIS